MGPITGWLIDRFGVRPLMFFGTLIVGIGYILLSQTSTYLGFLLVYLLVISVGASTSFMAGDHGVTEHVVCPEAGHRHGHQQRRVQAGRRGDGAVAFVRHL